ncbi:hypothetical protein [Nocardia sp. NPDC052566]|uniref:hypothetical protein n=1 Tax=Nocardia sp. NPDC052566 TaxID=3364330 RepID=UPI0037C87DC2
MKRSIRLALGCCAMLVLAGCGGPGPTATSAPKPAKPQCDSAYMGRGYGSEIGLSTATRNVYAITLYTVPGQPECTMSGYLEVEITLKGGKYLRATPTLRGPAGGLPANDDRLPVVDVISTEEPVNGVKRRSAVALLEGPSVDSLGRPCPTSTEISFKLPNWKEPYVSQTEIATFTLCAMEIHPLTARAE